MSFINLFPTLDLFVLFLFVAIVILDLLFIRKDRLLTHVLSVYGSFVLTIILPIFISQLNSWLNLYFWVRAVAFVGLYLVLAFVVLRFSNLGEFSKLTTPTKFSTSLAYRLGITGLLFSTVLFFLPISFKSQFGPITTFLFINLFALVFWFILPLFFVFAYRFKTRRGWLE